MQKKREHTHKKLSPFLAILTLEVIIAWLVFVGSAYLFFWMTHEVFVEQEKDLDHAAFEFAADMTTPANTGVMHFITFFGSKEFLVAGSLGLAFIFLVFKKWRFYSVKIIAISATTTLFNQSMKFFFDRPRPDTAFLEQSGNSFPSGHAMIGGAFWGLIIYLIWTNVRQPWLRWLLVIAVGVWIVLIGFSRVYLNVHYASDVLAGWAAGIFWLMVAIFILKRLQIRLGRKVERQMEE